MNTDWHELIQRYIAGTTTAEEAATLQGALKNDAELRTLYLDYMNLDLALEAKAGAAEMILPMERVAVPQEHSRTRWLQWRPITAAAAGLVIGLLSASVAWAYGRHAIQSGFRSVALALANPGFERQEMLPQTRLVPLAGQWCGVDTEIVESGGVRPPAKAGKRMIRLGPAPAGKGYFACLLVDIPGTRPVGATHMDVSAYYHASVPGHGEHYSLSVSAMAGDAAQVTAEWGTRTPREQNEQALAVIGRSIFPTAEESGWQRITVRLEVPAQARTIMINLGSNTPGPPEGRTSHFMDEVQASWLIPHSPLP